MSRGGKRTRDGRAARKGKQPQTISIRPEQAPAWMDAVPDRLIAPRKGAGAGGSGTDRCVQVERWLGEQGLPRPSLYDLECERKRRGLDGLRR